MNVKSNFFLDLVEGHIFCLNLERESQMLIAGKMNCQLHTLNWWREKTWLQNEKKNYIFNDFFFGDLVPGLQSMCLGVSNSVQDLVE